MYFKRTLKDLFLLAFLTLLTTFLIWAPFLFKLDNFYGLNFGEGINTIYRNYDGIEYIVIAKSWYNLRVIANLPQSLPANYYAAHFPLYSIFIALIAPILGYLKSMIFISLLFTVSSVWMFYLLIKNFKLTDHPLLLSFIFLILPARWLIVHSVGSSEPVFIFFTLATFYFFMKYEGQKKYYLLLISVLMGILAQLTRPPGILLFTAFVIYIHWKYFFNEKLKEFGKNWLEHLKYLPFILVPLTLLGIFYWYSFAFGDFWAYFHSGDNIHLNLLPFQVFNKHQFWVGEIWLEDIIYIFILGTLGGLLLLKQKLYPLGFFVLTYLVAAMLVVHRDISRYTLPIFPFLLIAFEKVLTSKEFKIVLVIVALAIYLYSQNFIINNTAPIPNLAAFN